MKRKYPHQLKFDFFPSNTSDSMEEKVVWNRIPENQINFIGGLEVSIHRWFRLTPSFGPDLVQRMFSKLNCDFGDIVLDPFAGVGTTMIECQKEGLTSYGFEINSFLHFVADTSLNWALDTSELKRILDSICEQFARIDSKVTFENLTDYGFSIPKIHNPTKWWRPDVLKKLLVLKSCIDKSTSVKPIKDFFRLSLAKVLVPDLTNVTMGRLQLHFKDRTHDNIKVLQTFVSNTKLMINDLDEIHQRGWNRTSEVFLIDSTNIENLELNNQVNCVITSPPYPNRYSYVWNTRPHLYFFDFFSTAKQAANLDKLTIGGTWGSATSMLAKGKINAEYSIIDEVLAPVVENIRQKDNLMANYAMKYFNLLAKQIVEMDRLLTDDARIAYVVGCSRLKKVYIETDILLGKIIEGLGLGYEISAIERIRKRHSGKNLYESIVYAWKKR